jgi:hypothetical protein
MTPKIWLKSGAGLIGTMTALSSGPLHTALMLLRK